MGTRERCGADILVVDDTPANLTAIEVALDGIGGRIVRAASGQEALKHLLDHDFAVVLLDVQMPDMDGFETARVIRGRERTAHLPIIFVTAHDRDADTIARAYELGAVDFLFKPIQTQILRAKTQVFVQLYAQAKRVAQLEKQELQRQLTIERERWEANRLREENRRKDEFIAMLAHELRNPLAPIVTGVELIELYGIEHEGLSKTCTSMSRQLRHLSRLVDDLLDISRVSSGKITLQEERVEIADVVERAAESVKPQMDERSQRLELSEPDEPVVTVGDTVRLTQVVSNLLSNASRYTPEGGAIRLKYCIEDGQVVLSVEDDGVGIPEQMLSRIFDQFVQADAQSRGLGLGLALVKKLVTMHDGQIEAFSEGKGRGSRFTIHLPLREPKTAPAPTSEETPSAPTEVDGELRVALVEDEASVREAIAALLEAWGHQVSEAENGPQGIRLVTETRPDVAIVDIGMPGMDGYTVARRIREQVDPETTRLIAMTGFGQAEDRKRAKEAGFDAHLTKPATSAALKQALRERQPTTDED